MRHLKSGRKLGRNSSHRKAMYRNMVTSLMVHGRIRTTEAKAKELRKVADRVITMGKRVPLSSLEELKGDALVEAKGRRLHNIRRARRLVNDKDALNKVFGEYAERFKTRPGGYTRIMKDGVRPGDNAPMAVIELVEEYTPAPVEAKPVVEEAAPAEPVAEAAPEEAEAAPEEAAAAPEEAEAVDADAEKAEE